MSHYSTNSTLNSSISNIQMSELESEDDAERRESVSNSALSPTSNFSTSSTFNASFSNIQTSELENTPENTALSATSNLSTSSTLNAPVSNNQTSELERSTSNLSTESSSSESYLSASSSISAFDDNDNNDDEIEGGWLNQPIYLGATLSGGDALCQILKVYVANRLSKKALGDMLTTINLLLPDHHTIPRTKYKLLSLIDKVLPHSESNFSRKHRICSRCFYYLGKWSDEEQVERCSRCNGTKLNSFFLEFNLESQLRNAFEIRDLHILMDDFRNECANRNEDNLYDLTSGTEYRRLKATAIPGQYDLCLIWFTDGVQVSKSGRSHMWPVYAQIVNIAPKFRRSFQFVCGIFYTNRCTKKPDMNSYLQPFASTLENLYTNGFEWRNQTLNRTITSIVVAPLTCLDAPAKASVQNLMQYNGENGCSSCEARGERCVTGSGSNWIFPIVHDDPPLRSAERMEKQTRIVEVYENLYHFKGVKGSSIVTTIPHFDRSKGFVPDYMHAVLLGVMLTFLNMWCNTNNHDEDYYLSKDYRNEIDVILETITPPDNVTRTPTNLSHLKDWKASELRAFLLYYGPVVLKARLNDVYYDHFLLLVRAIYLLSQGEIIQTELDLAETLLHIFVIDVEQLYGRNKCSYNVHQLLHLTTHVRMWGPLWVWSAFSSEDHNGELIRMAHGSNKIDVELSNTIKIFEAYRSIKYVMNPNRQIYQLECHAHGPPTKYDITNSDLRAIIYATRLTEEQFREKSVKIFSRCKINDEIFTSELYTRQKKRVNFYVQWKEGENVFFGTIKFFVEVENSLYAILRQFIISHDRTQEIKNKELGFNFNQSIQHVYDSYCIHVIPVQRIKSKILRVQDYVCHFPNNVEKK